MAVAKRAIPWWGLPVNWIIGKNRRSIDHYQTTKVNPIQVLFGNLTGSLFFAAILVHCKFFESHIPRSAAHIWPDTAIVSTEPYIGFIQDFAM